MYPKEHIPLRNNGHNDLYQALNIYIYIYIYEGLENIHVIQIQEIYNNKIQVNTECLIMYRPVLIRVYAIEREVEER